MSEITFRAVIEVLGKPQDHVTAALNKFLENLKQDKRFTIIEQFVADAQKQKDQDLWSAFAELELKVSQLGNITQFCLEYMPSVIEIIEPTQLTLSDVDLSQFFTDLQGRLHHVDMIAKNIKMEKDFLLKNTQDLLHNYIHILLTKKSLTSAQLSSLTGIAQDKLEDFLDKLIDEGKIELKENLYSLKVWA